jgi:anti-sigma regulatory factor (Ser/Thr protein kinase)
MDTANNATPAEKVQEMRLPAQPQAVRETRHRVHSLLRDWASPVDWDIAVLLLSEVLTNAILHGTNRDTGAPVGIRLIVRESSVRLRIEVYDHGGDEPSLTCTSQDWAAESGRGLELVDELASAWGWTYNDTGKFVYFDMNAPASEQPVGTAAGLNAEAACAAATGDFPVRAAQKRVVSAR